MLKSDKSAMEKWEAIQKLLEKAGNEAGVSFVGHDRQGDSDVHVPASGQKRVAFAPSFVEESVHSPPRLLPSHPQYNTPSSTREGTSL